MHFLYEWFWTKSRSSRFLNVQNKTFWNPVFMALGPFLSRLIIKNYTHRSLLPHAISLYSHHINFPWYLKSDSLICGSLFNCSECCLRGTVIFSGHRTMQPRNTLVLSNFLPYNGLANHISDCVSGRYNSLFFTHRGFAPKSANSASLVKK